MFRVDIIVYLHWSRFKNNRTLHTWRKDVIIIAIQVSANVCAKNSIRISSDNLENQKKLFQFNRSADVLSINLISIRISQHTEQENLTVYAKQLRPKQKITTKINDVKKDVCYK